ncbi:STAS domain-containing protein [Streptomyces albipurpureus]|uniref:STAS domain-containing protein n=1 Tax=Streptomyces albipurpureus TaxID=2897419 RepID=A0ABT0V2Z2_9ACTN|nr:STAS domain-containing protein [Streptomyces sp. CWNU-1]MCM2393908.1 STAS domain-containing protein [Streptomyces sp. CWNU-1]
MSPRTETGQTHPCHRARLCAADSISRSRSARAAQAGDVMARFSHHTRFITNLGHGQTQAIVHLAGELDQDSRTDAQAVLALCITTRPAHITVDLTRLTLLDRSGLTVLRTAQHQAADEGIPFTLTGRPPLIVARLLNLTGTPFPPSDQTAEVSQTVCCRLGDTRRAASRRTAARTVMVALAVVTVLASLLTTFA